MEAIYQERALLLLEQRKYEAAETEFRKALSEDTDHAENHAYLALCLMNQKRMKEAEAEAAQAIALDPDMPLGHYILSLIFYNDDKYSEAEASISEAIRLDPFVADFYEVLGSIHFQRKEWNKALEFANKGLSIDPEHVDCLNLQARTLNRLGHKGLATDSFEQAFSQDPDNDMTHANQGWTYLEQGQHTEALKHFQESLRLNPNSGFAREGLVEALKSKYWIYRAVTQLSYKMDSMSSGARWGMLIGMVLLVRVVPLLLPFYFMLVFFSWFSDLIFNTLMRFNRYGRYALNKEQVLGSNIFLALFTGGIAALAAGTVVNIRPISDTGFVMLGMLFPVAGTLHIQNKVSRKKSLIFTAVLSLLGAGLIACSLLAPEKAGSVFTLFCLGVLAYTWARHSF
ncbi:MAG: tetratricopeptide repeat protein [Hymenobacteraceae bacterium]|nr:tetratricopeptide repeat protein [Hymenobacteraceae bacterium]MDX5396760.1 tetratricopeptide repeat protein [Hymenobacteraceae bacterium]MDX5443138.1 tetratricopeptide repeat protein [Hymenobacteraceae bacterium]MDX5512822.1 tetratricopeptide repeat protein [Hymenobacteraceae bacterium]